MSVKDPSNGRRTIRFGIMCNGKRFQAWQAECLRRLIALDGVEPVLLIIDDEASQYRRLRAYARKLTDHSRLLWHLYSAFGRVGSRAMRLTDLSGELSDVPAVHCRVSYKGKFSQYFQEKDIEVIREYDPDFIIRFAFNIIRGEILEVPRYGVWSYHHDDETKYRGGPPCFWEIYNGDRVVGAILQRLTDRLDSGVVLKKGYFRTIPTSYVRNRDRAFFDSTVWPAQACVDIQNGNTGYVEGAPSTTEASILRPPTNFQMVVFVLKMIRNVVVEAATKFFLADRWNIAIVDRPISSFAASPALAGSCPGANEAAISGDPETATLSGTRRARSRESEGFSRSVGADAVRHQKTTEARIRWLPKPPPHRFSADPFAIRRGDALHILYEDFDYTTSKGRISAIQITGDHVGEPEVVLVEPFHLSHPYLFQHDGVEYCIPEAYQTGDVVLYRADDFPRGWKRVATLISGFAGVDSTVIAYRDMWWLFATDQDDGPNHKLKIWWAADLTGPWKPHPLNPVKIDVRSARPAGTPFVHQECLFRPAQDCSKAYGGRIVINRVTRLTPYEFDEEPAGALDPLRGQPYADGVHTMSGVGDTTVIDGVRKTFIGAHPAMVKYKLRRIFSSV